jgi:ligand-binding SRPBCC domain-containing protein
MRETEVERFVRAPPAAVEHALTPERVVEYEGTFDVEAVERTDEGTRVVAGARGIQAVLVFESREEGLYYEQAGRAGPFERMWTRLSWTPEDEGTRVVARSGVELGVPLAAVSDRVAAWKRRGELRRLLDRLRDDVG